MNIQASSFLCLGLLIILCDNTYAAGEYDCLIEPTQSVEVGSPVVGLLDKVYVHRGDKVSKGQIIASLESRAEEASTALAKYKSEITGPLKTAESKIEFSRRKFQRRRDMHAEKFMSGQEKDDAEAETKLAESEFQVAQENRQISKLEWQQQSSMLNLRTIRSPFDGVVVDQLLYPGEIIEPGAQKKFILKLAQLDPLRVHVVLPLTLFGKIKLGMNANVVPEVPVGMRYIGKVKVLDRLVDAASGTFGVFLEVANSKLEIPAGVKCKAEFQWPVEPVKNLKTPGRGDKQVEIPPPSAFS